MAGEDMDMFEKLTDYLLILIISCLPFKEAAKSSVLSKRWRNIWNETRNIEFHEGLFVDFSEPEENREEKRILFVQFMRQWIQRYPGLEIDRFELTFSKPGNFQTEILSLLEFAYSRNVKTLFLDFSDPAWKSEDSENHVIPFDLPPFITNTNALQSLKLYACKFLALGLKNFNLLKNLFLGWTEVRVGTITSILVNCPLLESLSIKKCWNIEHLEITGQELRLRKLVIDKCSFTHQWFNIDAPNLKSFMYSGNVGQFYFDRINRMMEEAELDFGLETEFDEVGLLLYNLLHDLTSAMTLTVCSYLLQVIPSGEEPLGMRRPLHTKHLILKTALHEYEFLGIKFMLNSCPNLQTLTIHLAPPRILENYSPPYMFKPEEFWVKNLVSYKCLRRTLKVVEFKGFQGFWPELHVLQYLLYFGRRLQRLDLYVSEEMEEGQRRLAMERTQIVQQQFRRASNAVQITVYS